MTTTAGVGNSTHPDPVLAATAAMRAATRDLRARSAHADVALALAFATAGYDQDALVSTLQETLHASWADAQLVGCSVEGTITADGSTEEACAVAVMLIASPGLVVRTHLLPLGAPSVQLSTRLTDWLVEVTGERPDPDEANDLVLFMADGLDANVAELIEGLDHDRIPVPIVGGLAGDALTFRHTWIYADGLAREQVALAVYLRGRFTAEIGIAHGCEPVGLPLRVTSSQGQELVELDGRRAWDVVREYLDVQEFDGVTSSLISLAVQHDGEEAPIIRSPFALVPHSGALRFASHIPQGALVHLTRRNTATIRTAGEQCARELRARHPGRQPALVVQLDCAHRGRVVLGAATSLILVSAVRCILGTAVPWIGGHTFGEIAPVADRVSFHNFSVVLLALYDL